MEHESVREMWRSYLSHMGEDVENTDKTYKAWHFCSCEEDANELAELTRKGIKRATASLHELYQLEKEPVPVGGELSIITNWDGAAQCIIQTTKVSLVPFNEVTAEFAATEGEGDKSLTHWKKCHLKFFTMEMESVGRSFHEGMLVVCEEFEVVYPIK